MSTIVGRAVHRLERADAKQHVVLPVAERRDERRERRAIVEIAAVRPEVHAGDRDFLVAGGNGAANVVEDSRQWTGASAPRVSRDDAVAARFVAAGLHAQRERRAAGDAGRQRCARTGHRRRRTIAAGRRRLVLVGVADDANDVRQRATLRRAGASRNSRSRRPARPDWRGRCAGSSAARPDRRSPSPSRC